MDDDEFTGLFDANLPRADLVSAPANGVDEWLVMKGAQGGGLLDPDFVRDLIAKEDQAVTATRERQAMPNGITLSGSPAQIAAFIHAAAVRKAEEPPAEDPEAAGIAKAVAEYEQVIKAKYSAADRKAMAGHEAMEDGSYPVKDEADLTAAIRAVGHGGADHDSIRRHVIARAKALGKSSEIPDNWNADGSLKSGVSKEAPVASVAKDLMDAAGDAMPLDGGMDGMDPTVPLACPEDEAPGDPTDPGSPAWEAIDAATAAKWLSIAARLKNALCVLAEREMLEAASADPDDIEHAWDLEDAKCAVEYAIEQLAVFAACEQAEAELGAEMEAIGKALAGFDTAPLAVIEGLAEVRKSGRVLSSANEAAIRGAVESLQKVLASLPEAPVAKSKEGAMPATATAQAPETVAKEAATPEAQAADAGSVNAGGTTGMGEPRMTGPAEALPADGPQKAMPGDVAGRTVIKGALKVAVYDMGRRLVHVRADRIFDPAAHFAQIAKADGDADAKTTMQAVFDENGNLVGIVDPADITPVAGAGGGKPDDGDGMQDGPAADADDMTPQPPADAGTPADQVGKAAEENVITVTTEVLKSIAQDAARTALEAQGAAHQEVVAKMAADNGELREELRVVKERLATVEEHPAAPGVFTNGAVPPRDSRPVPPAHQLRGQDQGAIGPVDIAKAAELKQTLYTGSGPAQAQAFHELEGMAITRLHQIRSGQRSPAAAE